MIELNFKDKLEPVFLILPQDQLVEFMETCTPGEDKLYTLNARAPEGEGVFIKFNSSTLTSLVVREGLHGNMIDQNLSEQQRLLDSTKR